ncbi:uncharacterized protein LOC118190529 isoform X2 [Stegodyphus dumicola]|uniref:uncharacterized protein LOC118190529 isoform X2 n=1 Tax=Stegodyphus dumicola TaxID=202533 RepID=UPI0015A91046|nr:uncharacterized protein LOC118190529 isoform X2 [Stegodyphus dumicola]
MIAAFRISSILLLLAAFVWRTKTETQWATGSHAEEEEEKKLNVVIGNLPIRSTLSANESSNDDSSLSSKDEEKSTFSRERISNFTNSEELFGDTKSEASPENSVDRETSNENGGSLEDRLEVDTSTIVNFKEQYKPLESLPVSNETLLTTTTSHIVEISDQSNCSFIGEKCKPLQSVQTTNLDSKLQDKMFYPTPSFAATTSPALWSIVKSFRPDSTLHQRSSVKLFPTENSINAATVTPNTPESSTAQTSENIILVEGLGITKDESVIQIHINKSEKSKHIKLDEPFADFTDRSLRQFPKSSFTIPTSEFTKESLLYSEMHTLSSTFLTKLFAATTITPTESSTLSSSVNSSEFFLLSSEVKTIQPYDLVTREREIFQMSSSSFPPPFSKETPVFYSPIPEIFSTVSWYNAKSSFEATDDKDEKERTETLSEYTPTLFPSFSESSKSKETENISLSPIPSFSKMSNASSFVSTKTTTAVSIEPILQPHLSSRTVIKDATTILTTPEEESAPPPRITNPGCSSLPICVEITLLETTWEEFCSQAQDFQEFLSKTVSHYTRPIHPHQIILDAERCSSSIHSFQATPDVSVAFYVTDDSGEYEERLTDICGFILTKWAPTAFRNSVMEVRFYNSEIQATQLPVIPELNSGFVAAVSISAVAGVALCLLCILLVIMKQKLLQGRNSETTSPSADAYSLDSLSINASFRRRRTRRSARSYLNHAFNDQEFPSHPLNEKSLTNCLKNRELLEEEFKKIPLNMPKLDQIPEGAHVKNRYSNILPKPESRVVLAEPSGDPLKCYINANYIKGYGGKAATYIACQAPLPEGIEDFWRMVWEQQSRVIIMLTMFEENGTSRCAVYFPQSTLVSHPPYGDFQVSLLKKDVYEFYTMSTFRLLDLEKNLFRDVVHLWYTSWPDVGVPKDPTTLISFIQQCRPFINCNSGPTVVHCSTGTGRTGVFIVLDICMREYDESRSIDILQCVSQLRKDRGGAVQNKDQYILIYEAMLEYISRMANQSHRPSIRSNS